MARNVAVVAGASGLIGRRIAERLVAAGAWEVVGLARKPLNMAGVRWIGVDLARAVDCRRALEPLRDVATHVFYAARSDHAEGAPEPVDTNAAMLANLVEALEPGARMKHVHAVHGTKYYGHQLGPVPSPLHEDSPRARGANFYCDQEDFLRERSRGRAWTYSTSRPHTFCDPAIDHPRSVGLVIAVFAAIQRELGDRLDFPGTVAAFEARTQFTDLGLLARAAEWMATEPQCANQAFNVVNGDHPRWSELWPRFAAWFGLMPGVPRALSLADYMLDKGAIWEGIVTRHSLRPARLDTLVLWRYGDYQFRPQWDVVSSVEKARALGFRQTVDTPAMFLRLFDHYRAERVIP